MHLRTILFALLMGAALPATADPVIDDLLPPIDDDQEGDHVVGEEMCARPVIND